MNVTNFDFNGLQLRTITDENGEPWFVAADVCKALEINDTSMAVKRLDDDEKGTSTIGTLGGNQNVTIEAIDKIFTMLNVCPTSRVGLSRRYFSKNVPDLLEVLPDYTVDTNVIVANSSDATLSLTALLEREGASIKPPQANLKLQSLGGSNSNWILLDGN